MTTDEASSALGHLRYTLMILGTQGPEGAHFMVGNWGMQTSFDPWRFVMALKKSSRTLTYARERGAFTVNLLDASQKGLVAQLMKQKGEGHAGAPGAQGAPRLAEAFAGFECKVLQTVDVGGDHVLLVADVVDGWQRGEGPALVLSDLRLSYGG